ncbi:hypothetical protein VCHA38P217_100054 [Vibrio chagasii]|nr:hypothetical protein VCHA34P120_70192 [Vibrio chagasii]CAH7095860.1 hypothetical protein VCHA38P217_100054 [Vibrio chagasii]
MFFNMQPFVARFFRDALDLSRNSLNLTLVVYININYALVLAA